jgi:DNA segregation ATPase FtsK/SpoIIIE, S-DNA-T family
MKIFTQFKKDKKNEVYGIILFAGALFSLLALISPAADKNYIGIVGAYLAKALVLVLGSAGAYLVPLGLVVWGWQKFQGVKSEQKYLKIAGAIVLFISVCSLLSLLNSDDIDKLNKTGHSLLGGYLGTGIKNFLITYIGIAGAYLLIITALVLSILLTTTFSLIPVFSFVKDKIQDSWDKSKRTRSSGIAKETRIPRPLLADKNNKPDRIIVSPIKKIDTEKQEKPEVKPPKIEKIIRDPQNLKDKEYKVPPQVQESPLDYQLPPVSLLSEPALPQTPETMEETLTEEANTLEKTLRDFGIDAHVTKICPGPVITRYEIQPAPGVKVNRITSLSDDIALALKASHVRILAPIPGKPAVGVEVPNRFAELVYLRELVSSKEFQDPKYKLPLALGKTISGEAYISDLAQMPHLLIAGATGSGKSICIHSLINSILFNAGPDKVKFMMIDPKMIEMPIYNDIPHLITPVITEARKAAHALKWVVLEMENRYKLFAQVRARDIGTYNAMEGVNKIPYLILVVDELADLMVVASVEVEDAIIRIAQMARAVGIHVILATQRPSVDVITGVIKANFPARLAFQTLSAIDSRIILDMAGAEDLLGKGDMLFLPPGAPKPVRLQGALISQKEAEGVVSFVSKQGKPVYKEDVFSPIRDTNVSEDTRDVLFNDAVRLVINTGQASISLLQRRLNIGYNRAARLVDHLEEEGIIGPPDGTKPREILVDENYLNTEHAEKAANES